jgi:hypothetical protein
MRRNFSNSSKTPSRVPLFPALAVVAALTAACGGSNGSGNGGTPPPSPGDGTTCSTAPLEIDAVDERPSAAQAQQQQDKRDRVDGNPRNRHLDALWLTRSRADRIRERSSLTEGRDAVDVGEIAVVEDQGDLIEPPNPYDLRNTGVRFTRNSSGGYDVTRIDGDFRTGLGTRLTLTDDDSAPLNVPFGFSFYGRAQTTAFVNSDGNITFEEEDRASTDRNVSRLLTGPPRVALFLADLDPSAGGRVFANAAADRYTVTWCGVRGFDSTRTVNAQVTLLPSGVIEMKYGEVALTDAIVGVSPGHTGEFTPVNLSDNGTLRGGSGAAVGERFADEAQLDIVEVGRKFYRTHADNFDQLVIWTDVTLIDNAFAFESTVANEVRGIGISQFDASRDFGSAGRLRSFTMMDAIGKYPEDPLQTFLGENNTVSVLGQEVGHRWLAFMDFRNHTGERSQALLGRDQAHWSFFMDTDASVMEGNDIEDLGGGSFRTVGAVRRYSLLDQYAMGLVAESQVPPFFYVDNPVNVAGSRDASSAPRIGVTFNGTRRDVLIQDIVAINGPRLPLPADSPKVHRQAFILVVSNGRSPDSGQIAKLDRIRRAWETFFLQATDNRMQAVTVLR